jgi:hypothetical protein
MAYGWLMSGAPPMAAKSQLESTAVRKLVGFEPIQTDNAFSELRAAILERGKSLGISLDHIQEWLKCGIMSENMKSRLQMELACSEKRIDTIFQELWKEIMQDD